MTPSTTRRTKSFDDSAWKSQNRDAALQHFPSAVSSVALSSSEDPSTEPDFSYSSTGTTTSISCGGGLDDILVIESESSDPSGSYSRCGTLSRGEVRKSRSKMKSYLKRCKDALIGPSPQTEDTCPITHHEAIVQHQQQDQQQAQLPPAVPIPTANWYLDDQLCEIRPEDNREPYSSFASARLKEQLESEEQQQQLREQLGHEKQIDKLLAKDGDDPLDFVNESGAGGGGLEPARVQGSQVSPGGNGMDKVVVWIRVEWGENRSLIDC